MELDFDKEIDAILRNARRDSLAIPASRHLDADEISAFAENAMPEKSRSLYAAHMADCDRCRKILSNILVMSSEVAPVAAASTSVITIAERSIPWYRSFFTYPNLAYVMGGLVLIFGGFLAFSVIQNSRSVDTAMAPMPAAETQSTEGGPRFEDQEYPASNAANAAANVAMADTASMSANSNSVSSVNPEGSGGGGPKVAENSFTLDGVSTADSAVAPPAAAAAPQAAPKEKDAGVRDDLARREAEAKTISPAAQEPAKNDMLLKQQAGAPVQSGPMRNNENQYNRQLENMDARAKRAARAADADASSGRKLVSGRTFERKDGVWYDAAYQGHPTINVRRGSDEFKRLDAGLRSIANSLSGTIVVVWGSKAYRIQ